jgi:hypothetical protein
MFIRAPSVFIFAGMYVSGNREDEGNRGVEKVKEGGEGEEEGETTKAPKATKGED